MPNLTQVPVRVFDALESMGYKEEEIARMSPKEAFANFCEWEGLIGYGSFLWELVEQLKQSELD